MYMQISPTDYVGLMLRSTAVATASWSIFEGTMMVLWERLQHAVPAIDINKT